MVAFAQLDRAAAVVVVGGGADAALCVAAVFH